MAAMNLHIPMNEIMAMPFDELQVWCGTVVEIRQIEKGVTKPDA
jgi:hypothetical protein